MSLSSNEICKRYDVAPSQVHAWKKHLLEQGAQLFAKVDKATVVIVDKNERVQRQLYEKIRELTVERDYLKKVGANSTGRQTRID